MPVDYTVNHMPVITQHIFIDAFAYDFSKIFGEMSQKVPQKKSERGASEDVVKNTPMKSGKDFNKDTKGSKINNTQEKLKNSKKPKFKQNNKGEIHRIINMLFEHYKQNEFEAQNANNPSAHLEELEKKWTKHMNIWSHNWSDFLLKNLQEKKL